IPGSPRECGTASAHSTFEAAEFTAFAQQSLGMRVRILSSAERPRVAVFVSRADHWFHDLMLRWKAGDFCCEIALVISNHPDLAEVARGYGLSFVQVPVTAASKADAEAKQLALLRERRIELIVLARYMQVLSGEFLEALGVPVINIH